jgi:hypothetical protein
MNKLFDMFMELGRWITPPGILALLAAVIAVVVLFLFRWTTQSGELAKRKNRMVAGLMEFNLFRDDPWIALRAFPRLLLAQAIYLRALILPFLISLLPIAWILVQAQYWVLHQPPQPDTRLVCKVSLNLAPDQMLETPFKLQLGPDSPPIVAPIRIPEEQAIYWSFTLPPGPPPSKMILSGAGYAWTFPLALEANWHSIVSHWTTRSWSSRLTNPRGAGLSGEGPLRSVELRYPDRPWRLAGIDWNGGVLLITVSFLFAWFLKKPMKVNL